MPLTPPLSPLRTGRGSRPSLAARLISSRRNEGRGPGVRVRDAFIDCARLVADFRDIVKRKMQWWAKIQQISLGASAPNPKFALPSRESDCELRVQKGH